MDNDLQTLLAAWLSDGIQHAELAPLIDRLRSDEPFRNAFTAELAMLGQLRAVQSSEPRWLALDDLLATSETFPSTDADFESKVMFGLSQSVSPPTPRFTNWQWWTFAGGLAATIALVAFGLRSFDVWNTPQTPIKAEAHTDNIAATIDSSSSSAIMVEDIADSNSWGSADDSVAVLSQSVSAKWGGTRFGGTRSSGTGQPAVGETLSRGDFVLLSGTVQLDFYSGVRLLLRAPADFQLRAPDEVLLRQGTASCFVTKMGRGFRIVTADMEVIDIGTAFSIDVQDGKRSEVHVLDGSVEIQSQQRETLELKQFQAIQMSDAGPVDVAYSPDRFPQPEGFRDQQRELAETRYQAWKTQAHQLSSDPDVLLHYTFEESEPHPQELLNRASEPSGTTNGIVIGCHWSEGRWPSKRALMYRHAGDRVLFRVPGAFREITFLMWVRVDALTQPLTSLLMTEEPARHARFASPKNKDIVAALRRRASSPVASVRWELSQKNSNAMLSVGHRVPEGLKYDAFSVDHPLTRSENWGQWACLAVTCDLTKREVVHYFNGEAIGIGEFERTDLLLLEFMELGNFGVSSKELMQSGGLSQRRFYGAFDEVIIAKRAMSADEIKTYWSVGNPIH